MLEPEERRTFGLLLDLEYLLAEVYTWASTDHGLTTEQRGENAGMNEGGRQVAFASPIIAAFVSEASRDALNQIATLRRFLAQGGERPYAASPIDLADSFTAMARGAALLRRDQTFDAFANESNLLLGAFMLEDVGLSVCAHALRSAASPPSRNILVDLLGSFASRATIVRTFLFAAEFSFETNAIATFRQKACGLFATAYQANDHGVGTQARSSIMPADGRGLTLGRTLDQCASILAPQGESHRSAFFPSGINALLARETEIVSLEKIHLREFTLENAEDNVRLLASFDGEQVSMPALSLDTDRFEVRENTWHQPWTESGYSSWSPSCIEISNAIVHGAVGIVGSGTKVIAETLWHTEPHRHRYENTGNSARLDLGEVETLDGLTVSILVGAAESYWHALIDAVARLILVPDDCWAKVRRVLYPSTGVGNAEMLELFRLPETVETRKVEPHESFRVPALILPSSLHGLFDYHPSLLRAAFDRLKSNVDLSVATPAKIFIDRRGSPLRKLENENELIAALPGFTPVRLETLTIEQQIRLFANAEIIVAPHGAGLTNIGFCRPGCVVIELMMDLYCNWCYRRLAAIANLTYRCVLGRCSDRTGSVGIHFTTWTVDEADLSRELRDAQDHIVGVQMVG